MLRIIKTTAIVSLIAVVAVAIVVFGTFIGAVLLFLGAVVTVALILRFLWWSFTEHRKEFGTDE